jgi:Effector Associated Constant Component 1
MEREPVGEVCLQLSGDDAADELRSLAAWLNGDDALHGRAQLVAEPPGPGSMGGVLESLLFALGPGSVAMAFASVLIAWMRSRSSSISISLSRPDGTTVQLDAGNVRALPQQRVDELTGSLSALLTGAGGPAAGSLGAVTTRPAGDRGPDGTAER